MLGDATPFSLPSSFVPVAFLDRAARLPCWTLLLWIGWVAQAGAQPAPPPAAPARPGPADTGQVDTGQVGTGQVGTGQVGTGQASTHGTASAPTRKLVVATREVPPFAMRDEDGHWRGIAIDLLEQVVAELNRSGETTYEVEFRDLGLKKMLAAVHAGEVDMAAAALTINFERERTMDFSHPFLTSGLGIAVPAERRSGWLLVAERIFSWQFFSVIATLGCLLFASGIAVYYFERRRNRDHFGGGFWRGLGAGLWWSVVTLTTVGYGDKAPKTLVGRMIAVVWMLSGILLISSFTAAVTSALTVGQLRSRISGPSDLARVVVGTVADSTSHTYLRARPIRHRTYPELNDALAAMSRREVAAVIYDAPPLKYRVLEDFPQFLVLPATFERQDYGFAMPSESPLRESVNRAILRVISQPAWELRLQTYLGSSE